MLKSFHHSITIVFILLILSPICAAADQSCPSYEPVLTVQGENIYKKTGNSVEDAAGIAKNAALNQPMIDFFNYLEKALDDNGATADSLACPYSVIQQWAAAGAMLQEPQTQGRVNRVFDSAGIGFILLKFKMRGMSITPDLAQWYAKLAQTQRDDYGKPLKKASYKGLYSNVYPWAALTNAISALISNDQEALQFQDEAWDNMIAQIGPDGILQGELGRAKRALVYHQLAADGLIALRQVRLALGRQDDPTQLASLKRLLDLIGNALCDPAMLSDQAGFKQEKPGAWGFRIAFAFGKDILPSTWGSCGPKNMGWSKAEYGGDTRVSAQAVAAASSR